MLVPVTAIYAAANGLLNVLLAINVTRLRAKHAVFLGHGDSEELHTAVRRHVNNSEYIALALLMLLLSELGGGNVYALQGLGAVLTLGRVLHAVGIGSTPSAARAVGALLTWLPIVIGGFYAVYLNH